MWLEELQVRDLRNIREVMLTLDPGLNVFAGRNAQGKTSLLEAVGLLARGRSFRTDETGSLIRRGCDRLESEGTVVRGGRRTRLFLELQQDERRLSVDGRVTRPGEYYGRLEVSVYSSDRLRAVRGTPRERRQFLDRSAAALWPSYRHLLRQYERALRHRNAALQQARAADAALWSEPFLEHGSRLRQQRAQFAVVLNQALASGPRPAEESYRAVVEPPETDLERQRERLARELEERAGHERRAGVSLVGPQRDAVAFQVNGRDAAREASSGQARSLLLAVSLAFLTLYRDETGEAALLLLDDLDSELDDERAAALCDQVRARGQALITTAHPTWAARVTRPGRLFQVSAGAVAPA